MLEMKKIETEQLWRKYIVIEKRRVEIGRTTKYRLHLSAQVEDGIFSLLKRCLRTFIDHLHTPQSTLTRDLLFALSTHSTTQ